MIYPSHVTWLFPFASFSLKHRSLSSWSTVFKKLFSRRKLKLHPKIWDWVKQQRLIACSFFCHFLPSSVMYIREIQFFQKIGYYSKQEVQHSLKASFNSSIKSKGHSGRDLVSAERPRTARPFPAGTELPPVESEILSFRSRGCVRVQGAGSLRASKPSYRTHRGTAVFPF